MLEKVRARRLLYARLAVPLAFAILIGRLWYVQIVQGPQFQQQASQNHLRVDEIAAPRGIIYDRYDQQLVENAPTWAVSVVPSDLQRAGTEAVLTRLAAFTHSDLSQLELAVRTDRNNPELPLTLLRNVNRDVALTLMEQADALPGVHVDADAARRDVDAPVFAPVVGYMAPISQEQYDASQHTTQPYPLNAMVGQAGIEQHYENELRGVQGHVTEVVDARGRTLEDMGRQEPIAGDSVELTIDAGVQRAAYQALTKAIQRSGATVGAAVAIDPRDGAVVALVSYPSFDANAFATGISQAEWQRLNSDPAHPLIDHAIAAQYPPGAVLDPFIATAALQDGAAKSDTAYPCPSVLSEQGWNFFNTGATPAGPLTVAGALAHRCDTLFDALGGGAKLPGLNLAGLGQDRLLAWLRQLGFGEPTAIELPGEASGFLPDPAWKKQTQNADWSPVDTYLVASGAGPLAVTPLQVAVATAALANGGTVWQPQLLQRIIAPDGTVLRELQSKVRRKVAISAAAAGPVLAGMAEQARGMSGAVDPTAGVAIAGLAAPAAPTANGPGQPGLNAWWTGVAPVSDPQLVVTVLVVGGDDPEAAAPVAQAMFAASFQPGQGSTSRGG